MLSIVEHFILRALRLPSATEFTARSGEGKAGSACRHWLLVVQQLKSFGAAVRTRNPGEVRGGRGDVALRGLHLHRGRNI